MKASKIKLILIQKIADSGKTSRRQFKKAQRCWIYTHVAWGCVWRRDYFGVSKLYDWPGGRKKWIADIYSAYKFFNRWIFAKSLLCPVENRFVTEPKWLSASNPILYFKFSWTFHRMSLLSTPLRALPQQLFLAIVS